MGKDALKRRICERDVAKITLSDVEKAKSLLSTLKMAEVEEISKAASTFFAWVIILILQLKESKTKVHCTMTQRTNYMR